MEAVAVATNKRGRPRLVMRHVTRQLAGTVVFGIIGMALFLTTAQFVIAAPQDLGRGMPLTTSLLVHAWQIPINGVNGAWLAMLAAQLLVLGSMARQREYMALLAGGVSIYQLCAPVLFVATVVALGVFATQEGLAPLGYEHMHVTKDRYRAESSQTGETVLKEVTYFDAGNRTVLFGTLDLANRQGTHVQMHRVEGAVIVEAVKAERAVWDRRHGSWLLYDVRIRHFNQDQVLLSEERFPVMDSEFRAPPQELRVEKLLASGKYELSYFSIANLQRRIRALDRSGQTSARLLTAYYRKWASPAAVVVVAIIAMPGSLSLQRAGIGRGVAAVVLLCCAYGAFNEICMVMGNAEKLPPMAAAWIPHVVGAAVGLTLLGRAQT